MTKEFLKPQTKSQQERLRLALTVLGLTARYHPHALTAKQCEICQRMMPHLDNYLPEEFDAVGVSADIVEQELKTLDELSSSFQCLL